MSKRERPLCCRKWENWKSSLRILFVLLNMEIAFLWKKPPLLQPVSDFRFWTLSRRCVCEFLLVYNQAVILWNWMYWTAIRLSLRSSHHENMKPNQIFWISQPCWGNVCRRSWAQRFTVYLERTNISIKIRNEIKTRIHELNNSQKFI